MSWMDREGKTTPLRASPADWLDPVFSPDGRQLAMAILDRGQRDVWIYDWMRDIPSRLTSDPANDEAPVWTPDGRRIAFASQRGDGATYSLYLQRADGMGEAQRLTKSRKSQFPGSWHPTGGFLAFTEFVGPRTDDYHIVMLPMNGDEATGWTAGEPTVFLSTPANEGAPMFSPDGRWLAYSSDESGRYEVYVRPFPGPGGKWQISTGGTHRSGLAAVASCSTRQPIDESWWRPTRLKATLFARRNRGAGRSEDTRTGSMVSPLGV